MLTRSYFTAVLAPILKQSYRKPMNHIVKAIAQCERDKADLESRLKLLRQALKPQRVTNGHAPEPMAQPGKVKLVGSEFVVEPKPAKRKRARKPTVSEERMATKSVEHSSVDSVMGDEPYSLDQLTQMSGLKKSLVRSILHEMVEAGTVIQSGNKRGLRFIRRGVEFAGGQE